MAIIKCQHCGHSIEIDTGLLRGIEAAQQNRQRNVNQFASSHRFDIAAGVAPQVPPGLHVSRETPLFLPTLESNVYVPQRQAIITAMFAAPIPFVVTTGILLANTDDLAGVISVGILAGGAGFIIGVSRGIWPALGYAAGSAIICGVLATFPETTLWPAVGWGFLAASGTFAWVGGQEWLKRAEFFNNLLTRFEEMTGVDINQDGQVGDRDSVDVHISGDQGQKVETWPVSKRALVWFAKAVVSGNPADTFSESTARQAGMSRKQWLFIRDTFINHRWAYWRNPDNPKLGVELTGMGGRKILQGIARGEMPAGTETEDSLDAEGGLRLSPHSVDRSTGRGNWE